MESGFIDFTDSCRQIAGYRNLVLRRRMIRFGLSTHVLIVAWIAAWCIVFVGIAGRVVWIVVEIANFVADRIPVEVAV